MMLKVKQKDYFFYRSGGNIWLIKENLYYYEQVVICEIYKMTYVNTNWSCHMNVCS